MITKLYGLYDHDDERANHSTADDFGGVFHMVTVCTWLVIVVTYLSDIAHPTAQKLVVFWASAIAFVCVARAGARALARRNEAYVQNTVIVGAGDVGQLFAKKLLNHPEYGINLVGFVDAKPKERREDLEHLAVLGDSERLPAIVRLLDVERVIVAFSNDSHEETLESASLREGSRSPDRHRAAALRVRRPGGRDPHRRGSAARRAAAAAALAVVPPAEAGDRPRAHDSGARRSRAALSHCSR